MQSVRITKLNFVARFYGVPGTLLAWLLTAKESYLLVGSKRFEPGVRLLNSFERLCSFLFFMLPSHSSDCSPKSASFTFIPQNITTKIHRPYRPHCVFGKF